MINSRRYIIIASILLPASFIASAQERTGYVTDPEGEPVDLATVTLFAGDRQMAVAVTDSLGRFTLPVAEGIYTLRIRNIACEPLEQTVHIASGTVDLGRWEMAEAVVSLPEVAVTAPIITREADRFVMYIQKTPLMLNKDAAELLRLSPGVWIDDSGISINGMKGVKVFINERELKLPDSRMSAYLRNFSSPDIARMEIIPQAGAEYGADSRGGVIKIILRRQTDNGMSGNVLLNTSQSKSLSDLYSSATLNARVGALTLNAFASGNGRPKEDSQWIAERIFNSEKESAFHSQSDMARKTYAGMGRLGAVYDINSRHTVGAEMEFDVKDTEMPSSAQTAINAGGLAVNGTSEYRQDENDRNLSAVFNYVYRLDTLGSVVKLIADYTEKKVSGKNTYHSLSEVQGMVAGRIDSVYGSNTSAAYGVFTADLSVGKLLSGGMKFSAGAKYTRNKLSDTLLYESHSAPLPAYSFMMDYTEDVAAMYGIFSISRDGWNISAGLRGEYTQVGGTRENMRRSYLDLFPNLSVAYSFNAMRTFMLIGQYTRNIRRPEFRYLNPSRIQYSDYSYMQGNPALQPTYLNRFGITAVYRYRYILSAGGTMHRNLIREVCKIDPFNPDVTYVTPENHHAENHYYAALMFPLRLAAWCELNVNLIGVKQDIRGTEDGEKRAHYLYFNNLAASVTLPAKCYLEVLYSGTSRLYSANAGIAPSHLFHASLKKSCFSDRLTASVGVHNIFDRKASYFSETARFTMLSDERSGGASRHIKIGLQYHFNRGKSFRRRAVESASATEKERLRKSAETEKNPMGKSVETK
jgi:outer membrane receptor for ferrienterochelin and colicin